MKLEEFKQLLLTLSTTLKRGDIHTMFSKGSQGMFDGKYNNDDILKKSYINSIGSGIDAVRAANFGYVINFCKEHNLKTIFDIGTWSGQFPHYCNLNGLDAFSIDPQPPHWSKDVIQLDVYNMLTKWNKENTGYPKIDMITSFNCPDFPFGGGDEIKNLFYKFIINSCKYFVFCCDQDGLVRVKGSDNWMPSNFELVTQIDHSTLTNFYGRKFSIWDLRPHAIYKVIKD